MVVAIFALVVVSLGFIGLRTWLGHYREVMTDNHQTIDKNVRPVPGAYGFNLGDVLPDNFQIRSNDEAYGLTYDTNILEGDLLLDGFVILTQSRQIAEIQTMTTHFDHFESVKAVLREKYGLRETYQDDNGETNYFFGTTNRQAILKQGRLQVLEYRDEDLIKTANTETENRKAAAKKRLEDEMKKHL